MGMGVVVRSMGRGREKARPGTQVAQRALRLGEAQDRGLWLVLGRCAQARMEILEGLQGGIALEWVVPAQGWAY